MRLFSLTSLLLAACGQLAAQVMAPGSLAGKSAVVVISTGDGSFASAGGYRISFGASSYAIAPLSTTVAASTGTYAYARTGASGARLALTATNATAAVTQTLAFSSHTSATYALSGETGTQTGTFVLEEMTMPQGRVCLINMSVRAQVLAGSPAIPGFVLDSPCRVLIRAAGPGLTEFGVGGVLPNPKLSLMVGDKAIVNNDDWASTISNYDTVRAAADKAGAFPFRFGSRDAALVVDLAAGSYSCVITGEPGTSGEVLLEVYRVP